MKLKIRVYISDDDNESFMGIGVLWLLQGIEKHKSIRKAAIEMDMSYTKAYKILKKLESSLGENILERQKGGNNREGTSLTTFGSWFLNRYEHFNNRIEKNCHNEYGKFLKDLKDISNKE